MLINFNRRNLFFCGLVFIGIVVFCILGLPFTNWGFLHDDFGVIWHSKIQGLQNVLRLFYEHGMSCVPQPSNYMAPEQSFFAILYRPLVYVAYTIQMLFFNFNPYGYFLVMIFFHALNAMLLFYFFSILFDLSTAFWASLFFGFHLSLWDWMGWIAGQSHVINLTLILVIVLLFYHYINTYKFRYYAFAAILLLMSLFYRETAIILPFWFVLSLLFLKQCKVSEIIKHTWLFFAIDIVYLVVRFALYPLSVAGSGLKVTLSPLAFVYNLKNRFFDVVTFLVDVANLSWLSGDNRLLKGFLLTCFFSVVLWLFYKNSHKTILLYCLISMTLFMWPALLRYYSSRYLYKALPFLIVFFIYIFLKQENRHRLTRVGMFLFVGIAMMLLPLHLKTREVRLHKIELAFKSLANSSEIKDRKVCFVGLPYEYFPTGAAQALFIHGVDPSTPVYYDTSTFLWSKKYPAENPIRISIVDNVINLEVIDKQDCWFNPFNQFGKMGEYVKNKVDSVTGMVRMLTQVLDKKYAGQNLLFVTWDYKNWHFKIL